MSRTARRTLRLVAAATLLVVTTLATTPLAADAQSESAVGVAALGPPPASAIPLGVGGAISVVLVEGATGQVLVARDEDLRRPIASAIKLLTALTVVERIPAGRIITVGPEVRGVEGSSYGLRPGEVRSVEDLLAGLLLRSGNDAAVALAVAVSGSEEAFVEDMVATLMALGIDARPGSSSGLELEDALSALELARLARAALAEPRIRAVVSAPVLLLADGREVENRNLFLGDTQGASGLKTGFTSAAGYTLAASARRGERELVAVVLGAADDRERREVAARLIEHGFAMTSPVIVERTVSLRTTVGPVRLATTRTTITLPSGAEVDARWPRTLRPDDQPVAVELTVEGVPIGTVEVERLDGRRPAGRPSLGRALADGAYAALRPFALAGPERSALR